MSIRLDYKFDNNWTDIKVTDAEFIDSLVEYADKQHMVKLDGRGKDIYNFLFDILGNTTSSDFQDLLVDMADIGEFGEFIHQKFEREAKEKWEEEKLLDEE